MSLLVIFTTAPTGLGHLRVMDALAHGLPSYLPWLDMGLENFRANKIHALGSRVPFLIKLTEFYQTNSFAESIVAGIYTIFLRSKRSEIKSHFSRIAVTHPDKKKWIVVCTHFSLAHSIAASKKSLERYFDVSIFLCVIVTDDSPQRMWAVKGADAIFVPSDNTHQGLAKYLTDASRLHTISFPVSPKFSQLMTPQEYQRQVDQLDPSGNRPLHIQIPVSGAAVQLEFFSTLMNALSNEKYLFTVIGQETLYTKEFFEKLSRFPRAQLSIGTTARETVDYYESAVLSLSRASIEITKPSEQIFKALVSPKQRGGLLLFLTAPVGRQEYDNLSFLRRHKLMPTAEEEKSLQDHLLKNGKLPIDELAQWQYKASHWRALSLPSDPMQAAKFIVKLKETGILYSMLSFIAEDKTELTSNGVAQVWQEILRNTLDTSDGANALK